MVIQVGPIGNPLGIRGQIYCVLWKRVWGVGGEETPVIPDEPDAPDAGGVLQALGYMIGVGCVRFVGLFGGFRGRMRQGNRKGVEVFECLCRCL